MSIAWLFYQYLIIITRFTASVSKPSQSQQFGSITYCHLCKLKKQYYQCRVDSGIRQCPFHFGQSFMNFISLFSPIMLVPESRAGLLPLALGAPKFAVLHAVYFPALLSFSTQLPCRAPWQFIGRWQRQELTAAISLMWLICWPRAKLEMFLWWALHKQKYHLVIVHIQEKFSVICKRIIALWGINIENFVYQMDI